LSMDFYEVLGVDTDASDQEIRAAYFRQVRANPPHKDQEQFEVVRRAYETLSNAQSRQSYDAMRAWGGTIEKLTDEAAKAFQEERWLDAARPLRHALALNPRLDQIRSDLGFALTMSGWHEEAVNILEGLVERCPDNASYWSQLGFAYKTWGLDVPDDDGKERLVARLQSKALAAIEKAVELEPSNPSHCIIAAQACTLRPDYAAAIDWLEKAVDADGEVDLFDFDALLRMCSLAALGGYDDRFESAVERIIGLIPADDLELRDWAVGEIFTEGYDVFKCYKFSESQKLARVGMRIGPAEEELVESINNLYFLSSVGVELKALLDDESFSFPVWKLALYEARWAIEGAPNDAEDIMRDIFIELAMEEDWSIDDDIKGLEKFYPNVYVLIAEVLDTMLKQIRAEKARSSSHQDSIQIGNTATTVGGSGCLVSAIGMLGIAALVACGVARLLVPVVAQIPDSVAMAVRSLARF